MLSEECLNLMTIMMTDDDSMKLTLTSLARSSPSKSQVEDLTSLDSMKPEL